jgi:lysophospholipase L1-like esterase
LNETFHQICSAQQARYVDVFRPLRANSMWMHQVVNGDGAHPSAGGYAACAEFVWPYWSTWISQLRAN